MSESDCARSMVASGGEFLVTCFGVREMAVLLIRRDLLIYSDKRKAS